MQYTNTPKMSKLIPSTFFIVLACVLVVCFAQDDCNDSESECEAWALAGFCGNNPHVTEKCRKSCHTCAGVPIRSRKAQRTGRNDPFCKDNNANCREWTSSDPKMCAHTQYIIDNCRKSCQICGTIPPEFDITNLPNSLRPLSWLVGKWRAGHGGKARFPTIPVFTYGEQLEFSIAEPPSAGARALNYTAFAWGINEKLELHSEYGFMSVREGTNEVSLSTVMNNGFVTIEEGRASGRSLRLRLQDIGRISFSRDLPVHDMVRNFRMIDSNTLEHTVEMETLTHGMQEHLFIRYKKIFP